VTLRLSFTTNQPAKIRLGMRRLETIFD